MKTWWNTLHILHGHFIPGEHNSYQPHLLRLKITAAILGIVIATEGMYLAHTYLIVPHSNLFAAIFATALVDETNQKRIDGHLSDLVTNPVLEQAAQLKANDMAAKGYFAHNTPDGKTPWYWFDQVGYNYAAAGENLAVNFTDSKDVTDAWMASPSHRANILNGNYSEIGIATAHGTYKGRDAIFVVEEFGRPSLIARDITIPATVSTSSEIRTGTSTGNILAVKGASTTLSIEKKPLPPTVKTRADKLSASSTLTGSTTLTQIASTSVAGAETTKLNADVIISGPILERTRANVFESLIASPRQTTGMLYYILAGILALALCFAIFIKIRVQHPHIVANGMLLIAIIVSLVMLNAALGFAQGVI